MAKVINMISKSFSKYFKFLPLLALIVLSAFQYLNVKWALQEYEETADRNYETLDQRMLRDEIPPNIKEHIIYVQQKSTSNTRKLVETLVYDQMFTPLIILFAVFAFYFTNNRKTGEQSDE